MEPQIPCTKYFSPPTYTSNNPFFINSTITRARKKPKRTHTVDRSITTQVIKKPKSTQTRASEWGRLLPPETENQALQIPSESSLSSVVDSNLGFHNSVQDSALRKANLDSHNTLDQVFIPEGRATLPPTTPQPAVVVFSAPAVVPLAPEVTTTSLDFSKYLDYVYSAPTGRPRNGWIWAHGYDIQHLRGVKKNGKAQRR